MSPRRGPDAATLARLRRQAGAVAPGPQSFTPTPPVSNGSASSEALRRVALPARLRRPQSARSATVPLARSRLEPSGENLAEGFEWVERDCPELAAPATELFCLRAGTARRLVALDTETTGLSAGCGTLAFVLGGLRWDGRGWRLAQGWLHSPAGEAALLRAFAAWVGSDAVLLSYNGRSFDLPLLRGRLRMHCIADRLTTLEHVDLLPWVRLLYGRDWPDCRQATAEHRLLSLDRDGDLPGALAPAAWQRWLKRGDPRALIQVLEHNARDLLRLVRLLEALDAEVDRRLGLAEPDGKLLRRMRREGPWQRLLEASACWNAQVRARLLRSLEPGPGVEAGLERLRLGLPASVVRRELDPVWRRLRTKRAGSARGAVQHGLPGLTPAARHEVERLPPDQ